MIIPQYWAEARAQRRDKGQQTTIRRFGWSDTSQDDAQALAESRAQEALRRTLSGERLDRREPKVPYNGAEGVPIREEIVLRHGETVVTRNSYGAKCLNSPGTLFADIDFDTHAKLPLPVAILAALLLLGMAAAWLTGAKLAALASLILLLPLIAVEGVLRRRHRKRDKAEAEQLARRRASQFLESRPDWNLRLYRTPAGMRLLATHQPFQPGEPAVSEFFQATATDPLYARMCLNQQCFRARVSPKPWRMGIETHLKPRPGVWPVAPERLPERNAWIANYEEKSRAYAACAFVEAIGSGVTHPDVKATQELHDELSGAISGLPLA